MKSLDHPAAGLAAMVLACTIWGSSGIYYRLLTGVPVLEILAHRSLWSLVFFASVLAITGRLGALFATMTTWRERAPVAAAAVLISANWCGFIFSVQSGHALEASVGYYIFPLVSVALGVMVFGDTLRRVQWVAVALAGVAVVVLMVGLGTPPWIALLLSGTFGLYGVVKKLSALPPLVSTGAEVLFLLPLSLGWLLASHLGALDEVSDGAAGVFGQDLRQSLLLIISGPLTGLPLLLFSFASKRISLTSLGLTQYLNPTLQFLVAVIVFGEVFTPWHQVTFALIWGALALYSVDGIRRSRRKFPQESR